MQQNNAFTVAKRTLEGQDMVYQSIKFTNNVWALAELKIQPGNPNITVSIHILIKDLMEDYKLPLKVGYNLTKIFFHVFQLAVKSRAMDVAAGINQVYDAILHS